ncbi:MAG: hypothetical protein ACLUVC_06660 [Longibaculum sp.]
MDTLNLEFLSDLPSLQEGEYEGIAYDGQYFYLTIPQKQLIYILDENFELIKEHHVHKAYGPICYHPKNHCFYCVDINDYQYVYQLNRRFEETNYFCVSEYKNSLSPILHLAYHDDQNALMIISDENVIEMNEQQQCYEFSKANQYEQYRCLQCIGNFFVVIVSSKCQQCLFVFDCQGCLIKQFCIPKDCVIKDIICIEKCHKESIKLLLLVKKCSCQLCILCCVIPLPPCSCHCCDDQKGCCLECVEQNICDILESIALQETALSHILNAEGEKIQEAIELSHSVKELVEIDKSVNKTINEVMLLENVLYSKLNAIIQKCSCQKSH